MLKKPGRLQRRIPKNEKHEMEGEIEKVVKAHEEAQSAAEVADREEQIAHNKESRTTGSSQTDYRSRRTSTKDTQEVMSQRSDRLAM